MADDGFASLVALACHDLRTPLAAVSGIAKLIVRDESGRAAAELAGIIDTAAAEMATLLDQLGLAARIESGRYEPRRLEADSLELARSTDERVAVTGAGARLSTDADAVRGALGALAAAALRHGELPAVAWAVAGRTLRLSPLGRSAAVVAGSSPRDLGALVARMLLEALGGELAVEGDALRVELA